MSETAYFGKGIISPNGAVSIIDRDDGASSDMDGHTNVGGILLHRKDGDHLIERPMNPAIRGCAIWNRLMFCAQSPKTSTLAARCTKPFNRCASALLPMKASGRGRVLVYRLSAEDWQHQLSTIIPSTINT